MWIVVAGDQVDEYMFQLLKVPLYEQRALSKVFGVSDNPCRLPVSQIILQSLPEDGWVVFGPSLEHAASFVEGQCPLAFCSVRRLEDRQLPLPRLCHEKLFMRLMDPGA